MAYTATWTHGRNVLHDRSCAQLGLSLRRNVQKLLELGISSDLVTMPSISERVRLPNLEAVP